MILPQIARTSTCPLSFIQAKIFDLFFDIFHVEFEGEFSLLLPKFPQRLNPFLRQFTLLLPLLLLKLIFYHFHVIEEEVGDGTVIILLFN